MTADIIHLDNRRSPNPGNGEREAMIDFFATTNVSNPECFADTLLAEMRVRGFKMVPLEPKDER